MIGGEEVGEGKEKEMRKETKVWDEDSEIGLLYFAHW